MNLASVIVSALPVLNFGLPTGVGLSSGFQAT